MNSLFRFILIVALLRTGLVVAEPVSLTILHTNDLHARIEPDTSLQGGAACIAAYIHDVRQNVEHVLVLDAGDMTQGSPVSTLYEGRPIFEIMNTMGYDAATLGNHEFDNGSDIIRDFRDLAQFPLLSASAIVDGHLIADAPARVFTFGTLRVGVIGVTTDRYVRENTQFLKPEDAVRAHLSTIRQQCDIVIALTHLGVEQDKALARAVDGIDIIVGGHSHTPLLEPLEVNSTIIVQAGAHGQYVGRLDLRYDPDAAVIASYQGRLQSIPALGLAPHLPTRESVQMWENRVSPKVDVFIGHNPHRKSVEEMRRYIEQAWRETYDTDWAHQNPGGTRDTLPTGNIFARHIYNILPFDNTIVILELTEDELRGIDPTADLTVDKTYYTLVTNSYAGADIIEDLGLSPDRIHAIDIQHRDPVIDYILAHGFTTRAAKTNAPQAIPAY